jgi:hypothetical protein
MARAKVYCDTMQVCKLCDILGNTLKKDPLKTKYKIISILAIYFDVIQMCLSLLFVFLNVCVLRGEGTPLFFFRFFFFGGGGVLPPPLFFSGTPTFEISGSATA